MTWPREDRYACIVCGGPAGPSQLCSGLCESEYYEIMEALSELQADPSSFIEQYAEEHRPTVADFFRRMEAIA